MIIGFWKQENLSLLSLVQSPWSITMLRLWGSDVCFQLLRFLAGVSCLCATALPMFLYTAMSFGWIEESLSSSTHLPLPHLLTGRLSQNSRLLLFFCNSLLWSLTSFYLTWWTLTFVTPRPRVTSKLSTSSVHSPAHLRMPVLSNWLDTHSSTPHIPFPGI